MRKGLMGCQKLFGFPLESVLDMGEKVSEGRKAALGEFSVFDIPPDGFDIGKFRTIRRKVE
jgi:hypothetical protein